ncbi:MAG: DUF3291 domain-containing protein [Pseudomonadota bacterium]
MFAALYTFGIFRERAESEVNAEFHRRNDPILASVAQADGFVARAGYDDEDGDPPEWGPQVWPRWYVELGDGWSPATLSVWEDLEAIAAYAYSGFHGEAVRMGRQWFVDGPWPPFVIWWIADGTRPDWVEGVKRFHDLADNGPQATAFDLKAPFDRDGVRMDLDTSKIAQRRSVNASRGL